MSRVKLMSRDGRSFAVVDCSSRAASYTMDELGGLMVGPVLSNGDPEVFGDMYVAVEDSWKRNRDDEQDARHLLMMTDGV